MLHQYVHLVFIHLALCLHDVDIALVHNNRGGDDVVFIIGFALEYSHGQVHDSISPCRIDDGGLEDAFSYHFQSAGFGWQSVHSVIRHACISSCFDDGVAYAQGRIVAMGKDYIEVHVGMSGQVVVALATCAVRVPGMSGSADDVQVGIAGDSFSEAFASFYSRRCSRCSGGLKNVCLLASMLLGDVLAHQTTYLLVITTDESSVFI